MNERVYERLNQLRIEHDNLTITLMGLEAFIETLETEVKYLEAIKEEE